MKSAVALLDERDTGVTAAKGLGETPPKAVTPVGPKGMRQVMKTLPDTDDTIRYGTTPAVGRLVRHAERLVREGRRPTVDVLVAECGGSRSTAQSALQAFWADALPRLLAARAIEDADLPLPVLGAVRRLWGEAQAIATETAQAAVQADRDAARIAGETATARVAEAVAQADEAQRRAMTAADTLAAAERSAADAAARATAQIDALAAALEESRAQEAKTSSALAAAEATAAQMADRIADASETIERLERTAALRDETQRNEITSLREQHQQDLREQTASAERHAGALRQAHAAAFDELRAAHLHSEQRLMVELDTARTQARQAIKQAEALKGRHAAALERLHEVERKLRARTL